MGGGRYVGLIENTEHFGLRSLMSTVLTHCCCSCPDQIPDRFGHQPGCKATIDTWDMTRLSSVI